MLKREVRHRSWLLVRDRLRKKIHLNPNTVQKKTSRAVRKRLERVYECTQGDDDEEGGRRQTDMLSELENVEGGTVTMYPARVGVCDRILRVIVNKVSGLNSGRNNKCISLATCT